MNQRRLLLFLAALAIAIVTAVGARSLFVGAAAVAPAEAATQVTSGPKVLVAQRALPVGTIVTADAVSFQAWPRDMVRDAYFLDGGSDLPKLLGTVVRYPVPAGQPITRGALVAPGDRGFLAAALGPGMRAVTIAVSAQTGVGGFVFPGDHIDLMLTQAVDGSGGRPLKATETILENLRVLATDQSTASETEAGKTVVRAFTTVTLEVTPRIAEKIAVAGTIGELSLSLRAIADDVGSLDRAIASGAVQLPANATPEDEERLLKQAMSRPIDGFGFVTGGDVSRFQRRTVPSFSAPTTPMPSPVAMAPTAPASGWSRPAHDADSGVRVTRGKQVEPAPMGGN